MLLTTKAMKGRLSSGLCWHSTLVVRTTVRPETVRQQAPECRQHDRSPQPVPRFYALYLLVSFQEGRVSFQLHMWAYEPYAYSHHEANHAHERKAERKSQGVSACFL